MFDIGWSELLVIAVVAIVVVGPKDLPRLMRNFGFQGYDNVIHPGTNGKMAEINAGIGLVNLDALPRFVDSNRDCYVRYVKALSGIDGVRVLAHDDVNAPNYQYVVLEVDPAFPGSRDELVAALKAENILVRKYFWPGCHRMKPYRDLDPHAGLLLTETEAVSARVVVLPTGQSLPDGAIDAIVAVIGLLGTGPA